MGKTKSEHPFARAKRNKIQINFRFQGTLYQPTLDMEPTPANMVKASKMAQEIRLKIKHGFFVMSDYFPNLTPKAAIPTFEELARQYLSSKAGEISDRTIEDYRKILNCHWMPYIAGLPIDQIRYGKLAAVIKERNFKTAKTRNNCITPLKGVFELAVADEWIESSPAIHIKMAKIQVPEPDPFEISEVLKIIDGFKCSQWRNFYRYQFFSGQRPSETIAMQWSDIDFNAGYVRIDKVMSMGNMRCHTKNYTRRNIPLNSQMLMALTEQKQHTFMCGNYVFLHPGTNEPIIGDKPPRVAWAPVIRKLGLRYRPPYQTRSTSICMQILAGENPYRIAKIHGHNLETMLKHYATWIEQIEEKESKIENLIREQNSGEKS